MSPVQIRVETSGDLATLKETARDLQAAIKETKALGQDTAALDTQLKTVQATLTGENAAAIRLADSLEKIIAAKRKLGADTSAEEAAYRANPIGAKRTEKASETAAAEEAVNVEIRLAEAKRARAMALEEERAAVAAVRAEDEARAREVFGVTESEAAGHNKASGATDKHAASARLLHKALHPLAFELGPIWSHVLSHGLSEGFSAATLKMGAYIAVMYQGLESLKEYTEANKRAIEEMSKWPQWAEAGVNALKIQREAFNESRLAAHQFRLEIEAINRPRTNLEIVEQQIKRAEELHGIKERLGDAEYNLARAQIEAAFTNEVEKRQALFALEEEHLRRKRAAADADDAQKIGNLKREMDAAQKDAGRESELPAARQAKTKAEAAVKKTQEEITKAEKDQETAKNAREEIEKYFSVNFSGKGVEQLRQGGGTFASYMARSENPLMAFSEYQMAYDKLGKIDEYAGIERKSKGAKEKAEVRLPGLQEAAETAKFNLDELSGEVKAAKQKFHDLAQQYELASSELKEKSAGRKKEDNLNLETKAVEELATAKKRKAELDGKDKWTAEETAEREKIDGEIARAQAKAASLERENHPPAAPAPRPNGSYFTNATESARERMAKDEVAIQYLRDREVNATGSNKAGLNAAIAERMADVTRQLEQHPELNNTLEKTLDIVKKLLAHDKAMADHVRDIQNDLNALISTSKTQRDFH